jgi:hypothetical protein
MPHGNVKKALFGSYSKHDAGLVRFHILSGDERFMRNIGLKVDTVYQKRFYL